MKSYRLVMSSLMRSLDAVAELHCVICTAIKARMSTEQCLSAPPLAIISHRFHNKGWVSNLLVM